MTADPVRSLGFVALREATRKTVAALDALLSRDASLESVALFRERTRRASDLESRLRVLRAERSRRESEIRSSPFGVPRP